MGHDGHSHHQKAYIGAIIGAATSVAADIIKGPKQATAQAKAPSEAPCARSPNCVLKVEQRLFRAYSLHWKAWREK